MVSERDRSRRTGPKPPEARRTQTPRATTPAADWVLALQRSAGNAAVAGALVERPTRVTGKPLAREVRAPMEVSFGTTFHDVRIYEDDSPRAVGALAFARGSELHFAPGAFRPDTLAGRHVIAHELAHVVQQRRAARSTVQACGASVPVEDPVLEREADQAAQRAVRGERAGLGGPPAPARRIVQCYQYVDPTVWVSGPQRPLFPSQSFHKTAYEYTPQSTRGTGKRPRLKVSNAGDLAIEATTTAEVKTFYALPGRVQESNAKLAEVGSAVRLEGVGRTLQVPADPTKAFNVGDPMRGLEMMKPVFDGDSRKIKDTAAGHHECIEVMKRITQIGSTDRSVAVFEAGGQRAEQKVEHTTDPLRIGVEVTQARTPGQISADLGAMGAPADPLAATRAYGRLSSAEHEARSRGLGVNEFASPEVGEAFGTFRVIPGAPVPGAGYLDYSQERGTPALKTALDTLELGGPLAATQDALATQLVNLTGLLRGQIDGYVKAHTWNAHYAAVVAKSGDDVVTLENYNRDTIVRWEFERIRNNLEKQVPAYKNAVAGKDHIKGYAILAEAGKTVVEAQTAFNSLHALIQANKGKEKMWYFAMFGPAREALRTGGHEDQTFHAAMVALGDFANPLTLRLRRETTPEGWERHASGVNVDATKDDYHRLHNPPATPADLDVERTTLISALAYANAQQASHGRKGRVDNMRAAVNAVVARGGPNRDLAVYVQGKLATAKRSRVIR